MLLSLLATHTLALAYCSLFLCFLRFKDQGESRRVLRLSVGLQLNHLVCLPQSSSSGRKRAPSNPQQAAHLDRLSSRAALEDKSRSRTSTRQRRATTDRSSRRSYGLCAQDGHGLLTTLSFSLLPPQASGVSRNLASTALCIVEEAEYRPLAWMGGSSKNAIERGHSRASLCAAINSHSLSHPSFPLDLFQEQPTQTRANQFMLARPLFRQLARPHLPNPSFLQQRLFHPSTPIMTSPFATSSSLAAAGAQKLDVWSIFT